MRNYNITKKEGELWNAEVIDKYGNKYQVIGYSIFGKMKMNLLK